MLRVYCSYSVRRAHRAVSKGLDITVVVYPVSPEASSLEDTPVNLDSMKVDLANQQRKGSDQSIETN